MQPYLSDRRTFRAIWPSRLDVYAKCFSVNKFQKCWTQLTSITCRNSNKFCNQNQIGDYEIYSR